jgi:hypothetical protein
MISHPRMLEYVRCVFTRTTLLAGEFLVVGATGLQARVVPLERHGSKDPWHQLLLARKSEVRLDLAKPDENIVETGSKMIWTRRDEMIKRV